MLPRFCGAERSIGIEALQHGAPAAEAGLIATALLWMAFVIATEIFVAYERGVNESTYWVLAIANLATILVLVALRQSAG